jgi:hypothetical protein
MEILATYELHLAEKMNGFLLLLLFVFATMLFSTIGTIYSLVIGKLFQMNNKKSIIL